MTVKTADGLTKVICAPSLEKAKGWQRLALEGHWGPLAEGPGVKVRVIDRTNKRGVPSVIPRGKPRIMRLAKPPQ